MKIVFELYGEPQVSFSSHPYLGSAQFAPEWSGMRVEGIVCDTETIDGVFAEKDVFHLEGDLKSVRSALNNILDQLVMLERIELERFELRRAHAKQCAKCSYWYDDRHADDSHGDGKGNPCFPLVPGP